MSAQIILQWLSQVSRTVAERDLTNHLNLISKCVLPVAEARHDGLIP